MKETKKYGLIRRIDDFGRIILPKEIRQFLNIQENDPMEVSLLNRGVYLEKYQPLNTLESQCGLYLSALFQNCGVACAVCNSEYVIASQGIKLSASLRLSGQLQRHISNLEPYHYSKDMPVSLFDDGNYLVDTIQPVGSKEKPLGAVILLHYRNTTPEERSCAKLIARILTQLTINQ